MLTNAPKSVVPIAISGTRAVLRGDDYFPRHGPLSVSFGAALQPTPGAEPWPETVRLAAAARAYLLADLGEPDQGQR